MAAARFRARLAGEPSPAGERTARVLAGYRRTAGERGRGQARPFGASDLAAVLATCERPRRRGRGVESAEVAVERGRLDAVIARLLFMAGMRRSEVSALRWADVAASAAGDGMLVTVRRGKTNPAGETKDVRFVKGDVARAESADVAVERGRLDAVIAGLLFMAGMRRSEVSALRWADVAASAAGDGMLVTVRRGKTNPAGETKDVRFVKDDVARALQTLRSASSPSPGDPVVPLSPQMVGLRFQSAARSAGVEPVTAHSGRVGLASELTRRGASTTDVMLAGNWKTSRMVAHYSSGGDGRAGGGGAVPLKPRVRLRRRPPRGQCIVSPPSSASSRSVSSSASDSTMPKYSANVASTTERTASRNAAEGAQAPHRGGVVLVGHLVEGRDGQPLGWRGDAAVDTLSDDRAGCPHERPELGVVELVRVEHPGATYSSSRPSSPGGRGVRRFGGPPPERAPRPPSIAAG